MVNKLCIGTAQFGMNYGVSNTTGIPNQTELKNIINYCLENKINYLDTSASYGNSEITLGKAGVKDFKIITKIQVNKNCNFQSLLSSLKESCEKLKVEKLEGLLLHSYISSKNDDHFFSVLEEIKNTKLVNKIGVSIYKAEDMIKIYKNFSVDIFQIPLNILNRGTYQDDVLHDVRSSGAEIHIRSIFLQGLLLMDKYVRPTYFKKWTKLFQNKTIPKNN